MKYYWEQDDKNKDWFLNDSTNGLTGCRTWLLEVIPDKDSILDIGCGPGHIYQIFQKAQRQNPYLGIDINPQYLELASILFPGIQTRQTDCFFLPWPNESFDHSILFSVVECLPDFRKAIDEAIRITRKQIIITMSSYISLTDQLDKNFMGVNFPPDYIVRINQEKFINYIKAFQLPITSGVLKTDNQIEYFYWIIHKEKL